MKTTIAILLLSTVVILTACVSSQTSTTEIVELRDITEMHLAQPDSQSVLRADCRHAR